MTNAPFNPDRPAQQDRFHDEAGKVLALLRASLLRLIRDLPGSVGRAMDLQRNLGIGRTLAWRVFKVAHAANPLDAATQVPRPAAMRRLLNAAREAGAKPTAIRSVEDAMRAFEQLVKVHAGDRVSFDAMMAGGDAGEGQIELHQRRTAFRASSHIWGVQAATQISCAISYPGSTSDLHHLALMRGMTSIRRLRPDVPIVISRFRAVGVGGRVIFPESLDRADGSGGSAGPSLLGPFCTHPLPEIRTYEGDDAVTITELGPSPVGNDGAASCFLAGVVRDLPWRNPQPPHARGHVLRITLPVQTVILDTLFAGDAMFGPLVPQTKLLGSLERPQNQDPKTFRDAEQLPISVQTNMLGRGRDAAHCLEVPDYADMLAHVCERLGWDIDGLDIYRCRLEYPVLHSLLMMRFPLPERGNW